MSKNSSSILRITLPARPNGYPGHYAVDWQRDPPQPRVDEARMERTREAIRSKYRTRG